MDDVERIAAGLTPSERYTLKSDRFLPEGWEPPDPKAKIVTDMIAKGLFVVSDSRCGFERFKDAWITPTPICLAVRNHIKGQDNAG